LRGLRVPKFQEQATISDIIGREQLDVVPTSFVVELELEPEAERLREPSMHQVDEARRDLELVDAQGQVPRAGAWVPVEVSTIGRGFGDRAQREPDQLDERALAAAIAAER
jgi:hypothetical protein